MATLEEPEVFEITDFTTASDWERFIATIEEVINEWKLNKPKPISKLEKIDFSSGKWQEVSETITFSGFRFMIVHHFFQFNKDVEERDDAKDTEEDVLQVAVDMMTTEIDFYSTRESLNYWYGLREYVVISPAVGDNIIANESRAKLLLSSVCIALSNAGCQIPFFIQLHQKVENFYLGIVEGKGQRTNFQMVHLKRAHPNFSNMSGLLDIFKSKVGCSMSLSSVISVGISFTYNLRQWDYNGPWSQQPPNLDSNITAIGDSEIGKLPFGTWVDPISDICLSAIWANLTEQVIVDNAAHSDLEPMYAPVWRIRVKFIDDIPCLMGNYLQEFRNLIDYKDFVKPFRVGEPENFPITQALDRLTNKVPPIINMPTVLSQSKFALQSPDGPIPENELKEILFFLFPDALDEKVGMIDMKTECSDDRYKNVKDSLKSLKSVPSNCLVYFLAICLCHVNHVYGRAAAVVHLWHEFVLEMRHRWENNLLIPGLEPGAPDISTCLINQKLQMLNYCIERKKARDQQEINIKPKDESKTDGSSSDDEFYDCNDEKQQSSSLEKSSDYYDSESAQPDGRLRPCGNLKYVGNDQILYIPITQDPPPMTEDQLEAHADVLLKLGTDEEGSHLRAKMQSACLLSDMQSFKAANPNCQLEDFVRWYSPRDWITEGPEKEELGRLSDRMLVPDNMWQSVWLSAKPIPARLQRRLFDDTKEGEKVLHYLASLTPADLVEDLFPVLLHSAVDMLIEKDDTSQAMVPQALQFIITSSSKLPKPNLENCYKFDEVIGHLKSVEILISQFKSFISLFETSSEQVNIPFSEISLFTKELFEKQEIYIPGGTKTPAGKVLQQIFRNSSKADPEISLESEDNSYSRSFFASKHNFPPATRKEYILRTIHARPAAYSTPTVQRMYCSISDNDFRLAGAFTQDTTFQ